MNRVDTYGGRCVRERIYEQLSIHIFRQFRPVIFDSICSKEGILRHKLIWFSAVGVLRGSAFAMRCIAASEFLERHTDVRIVTTVLQFNWGQIFRLISNVRSEVITSPFLIVKWCISSKTGTAFFPLLSSRTLENGRRCANIATGHPVAIANEQGRIRDGWWWPEPVASGVHIARRRAHLQIHFRRIRSMRCECCAAVDDALVRFTRELHYRHRFHNAAVWECARHHTSNGWPFRITLNYTLWRTI